ncbi:MerR family transcriptional regulator [Pseudoglutamicibacter albus]|uniref:MerR family transcriptional regulator n=1 Tax=Pseudoglutamicibacter albus TaxID=98671 RepID=UPI00361DE526
MTASKIRFLEEKGLITPARTAAGYRKYTSSDVERLRFILALQRDQYLPLKVIKEHLDAVDAGRTRKLCLAEPRSLRASLMRWKPNRSQATCARSRAPSWLAVQEHRSLSSMSWLSSA